MARASTRSSARQAESSQKSSQEQSSPKAAGTKRKASVSASPAGKNSKKAQKTLEQTMPGEEEDARADKAAGTEDKPEDNEQKDTEMTEDIQDADMKDAVEGNDAETVKDDDKGDENAKPADVDTSAEIQAKDQQEADADGKAEQTTANGHSDEQSKEESKEEVKEESSNAQAAPSTKDSNGAVESSQGRGEAMPSNILEKGIIYFLTRARVGIDDPSSVQDIARTYIVLRPLPHNAKLTDGPIDELKNARLLALPKKVLPRSHRDVFMSYVEKAGATMADLKEEFFSGSTYSTQTAGVRTQPPITPLGEGVYAITSTNRATHLAYMLTIPAEMGSVQEDMGLAAKGAFALSLKNPKSSGPANTNLGTDPGFSEEIMSEFRGRGWMPVEPKHLEYSSAQFLLIGEAHGDLGSAVQAEHKDENNEKTETPNEEMEKLEEEDEHRVEALRGDDSIFDDLGISSKDYPKVQTTW